MLESESLIAVTIAGIIGWWILILLPGSWITFGIKSDSLPFGMKVLGGVMLSPLIVLIQFYILRLAGLPFSLTAGLLPLINLPALGLIWLRRREANVPPKRNELLVASFVVLICASSLAPHLVNVEGRVFSGHAWTHADIIYQLSNGALWPEEPELAGIRLAYPWGGHVYQGILSYLIDSAPVSSYIWTNLVWALCIGACVSYIVSEIGGNRFSRLTGPLWLFFGLNWLGYLLNQLLPQTFVDRVWIGGDYRYTPWILKFFFFEQIGYGLGMLAVLIYLTLRPVSPTSVRSAAALSLLLLTGIGVLYPIMIVPATLVVFSRVVLNQLNSNPVEDAGSARKHSVALIAALIISGLISLIHLKLVTLDRVTSAIHWPALTKYFVSYTFLKTQGSIVAISILVAAYLLVFIRERKSSARPKLLILGFSSALILLANIVVELPFFANEYKFILAIALCLSPFPAIALGAMTGNSTQRRNFAAVILVAALYAPYLHKLVKDYPWRQRVDGSQHALVQLPPVNIENFALRLSRDEEMYELCEAIRSQTPLDSVVVMEATPLHLPTLTQRSMFVSPDQTNKRAGVNLSSSELLTDVRGYDEGLFFGRRAVLLNLYKSRDEEPVEESLRTILSLNRPVAIILDANEHAILRESLIKNSFGSLLLSTRNMELWLVASDVIDGCEPDCDPHLLSKIDLRSKSTL